MNYFDLTYAVSSKSHRNSIVYISADKNRESSFNVISKNWLHCLLLMLQMILIINRLSLFLGDRPFIEEVLLTARAK